jgi:hypothetical protein
MVRMTYKTKDVEFTFEGQEDEVLRLYYKITGLNVESPQPTKNTNIILRSELRVDMPTEQEVEAFIKSKPNYEHDLHMIQKEFFGRTFMARGTTASMYHRTNRQVKLVREKIEKETGAKFKEQTIDRNFKRYRLEAPIAPIKSY